MSGVLSDADQNARKSEALGGYDVVIHPDGRIRRLGLPKTGGSSVEKALELHPHQVPDAKEYLSGTGKHLQHLTYSEMLTLNRDEEIGNCKKFCIIRNPIDRFHSEFRWRKKIGHPLTKEMDEYDFALHLLNRKKEGNQWKGQR